MKFYPREDLENQKLARYAERMLGELHPLQRQTLDEALDFYEGAMLRNDQDAFVVARDNLLMALSALGFDYQDETT